MRLVDLITPRPLFIPGLDTVNVGTKALYCPDCGARAAEVKAVKLTLPVVNYWFSCPVCTNLTANEIMIHAVVQLNKQSLHYLRHGRNWTSCRAELVAGLPARDLGTRGRLRCRTCRMHVQKVATKRTAIQLWPELGRQAINFGTFHICWACRWIHWMPRGELYASGKIKFLDTGDLASCDSST